MKRGRPNSSDRGGSARGPLGGGKRKPEPESEEESDDSSDEQEEESEEERPAAKKASGKTSARKSGASAKGADSARKRRTSASHSSQGGGRPGDDAPSGAKKAMFVATPIMAVIFIVLLVVMGGKKPEGPKNTVINLNDGPSKAKQLYQEALNLTREAEKHGEGAEAQKVALLTQAQKKLQDANQLYEDARVASDKERGRPLNDNEEYPFEKDSVNVSMLMTQVNKTLREYK